MATKSLAQVAFIMLTLGSVVTSFQIPLVPGGLGHRLVKRMARPDWVPSETGQARYQPGCSFCAPGLSVSPIGSEVSLLQPPTQYDVYEVYNDVQYGY